MAQARARKQWLQKQFQSSGIQAEPAALTKLVDIVEQLDDPEAFLHELLDEIETSKTPFSQYKIWIFKRSTDSNYLHSADSDERKVTVTFVDKLVSQYQGRGTSGEVLEVIDAFKVPLILYDPIRKLFHHSTNSRKIFADATVSLYNI